MISEGSVEIQYSISFILMSTVKYDRETRRTIPCISDPNETEFGHPPKIHIKINLNTRYPALQYLAGHVKLKSTG
jgi:hypothetical protein